MAMVVALLAVGAWRFVRPRLGTNANRDIIIAAGVFALVAYLPTHGDSEAALKAADEAMYDDKATKPGARRRAS